MKITWQETKNILEPIPNASDIIFQSPNYITSCSWILSRFQEFLRKMCSAASSFSTGSYRAETQHHCYISHAKPWAVSQPFCLVSLANERYAPAVLHQNNENVRTLPNSPTKILYCNYTDKIHVKNDGLREYVFFQPRHFVPDIFNYFGAIRQECIFHLQKKLN